MPMTWQTTRDLGYLPLFLSEADPRPAKEQFDDHYQGGWMPMKGFRLNIASMALTYPGDPPLLPDAVTRLREEAIFVYPHDWVLILQTDGTWEVARLD